AFPGGAVMGMSVVSIGLFALSVLYPVFGGGLVSGAPLLQAVNILAGFSMGASSVALFARVGGGIFTKAADVGADLVGKVEACIPEDAPRNPATIAVNVGDNVGDCAGMAADLFESYEVTLVASIILGVAAFRSIYPNDPKKWALGLIFPVIARAVGVLASIVGVFAVRATDKDKSGLATIRRGFITAGVLTLIGTLIVSLVYVGNDKGTISGTG